MDGDARGRLRLPLAFYCGNGGFTLTTVFDTVPAFLRQIEFSRVELHLGLVDDYRFDLNHLLLLRSRLQRVVKDPSVPRTIFGQKDRFQSFFDPPPSSDPVAVRRYQKPGPPFVIHPPAQPPRLLTPGDILKLPVVLWGDGIRHLAELIELFTVLGRFGLCSGGGRFVLEDVTSSDAAGSQVSLWRQGGAVKNLAPPICDAHWWLSGPLPASSRSCLKFLAPARILSAGRPLFRCDFRRLFPFILRRVASMTYAHCGLELVDDAAPLLEASSRVEVLSNRLAWQDWRSVDSHSVEPAFGGVTGELELAGDALEEVRWVLELGSLLNLGKGASFCAGHYRLEVDPPG